MDRPTLSPENMLPVMLTDALRIESPVDEIAVVQPPGRSVVVYLVEASHSTYFLII